MSGLMCEYSFEPNGVCCKKISFDYDITTGKIYGLQFVGGCNGNLNALAILMDGMNAKDIVNKFEGNPCGNKETSCMDQLAQFIKECVLEEDEE